jgi:hypothetical protein
MAHGPVSPHHPSPTAVRYTFTLVEASEVAVEKPWHVGRGPTDQLAQCYDEIMICFVPDGAISR